MLFYSSISEYEYRVINRLPGGSLTVEDDETHFEASELQAVVNFIEERLIPALSNESNDLLQKFGGTDGFYNAFNQESGFLDNIGLNEGEEFFYSDPVDIEMFFNAFKALLKLSLQINTAMTVEIDF